jgi:hypothetical protein
VVPGIVVTADGGIAFKWQIEFELVHAQAIARMALISVRQSKQPKGPTP